jgi:phosphoribosyl 1,2-cyclic phosphodiesterase
VRFASLGSGSEGNALLIDSGGHTQTRLLLDCGFGIREMERRLARLDCPPESLSGILVTHEHSDHIGSAYALAVKYRVPVWLSHGTWAATAHMRHASSAQVNFCVAGQRLGIGAIEVSPYTVPHDAREPLQFVLGDGAVRLGVLTDAGMETPALSANLANVQALVLECNHDRALLAESKYPPSLKARIGGDFGHLANDIAARILARVRHPGLSTVVAAHLSQQNNTPELAATALANALNAGSEDIAIADQQAGLDWRRV